MLGAIEVEEKDGKQTVSRKRSVARKIPQVKRTNGGKSTNSDRRGGLNHEADRKKDNNGLHM